MPSRVALNTLSATTIDILNVIRQNASYEYQNSVPEVTSLNDIPKVGEVLYGYPALANQFINALVNRIAMVRIKSAVFNNAYSELKKGYLEFGETVEEAFTNVTKANIFNPETAAAEEFQRSLPDVRAAFHTMNWRVKYPITIQDEDLRMAFMSINGVQDLIAKIMGAVYTAAEYDEFLLFKYLLIKGIAHGKMYPVAFDATKPKEAATKFRGMSNKLLFMSDKYNASGVKTTTPKADQYIFMDADYNAEFDVEVLAAAFNMEKADFMGKLKLIDDFTTFDSDRFSVIMSQTDGLEEVTDAELALMADVKAVLIDGEWFQVYDNLNKMTEKFVASGLYWNYFYHTWKTISYSPFSNAIVFVDDGATVSAPATFTVTVAEKSVETNVIVFGLEVDESTASLQNSNYRFVQTEDATEDGIAIHRYGGVIMPNDEDSTVTLVMEVNGYTYTAGTALTDASVVGDTFTMSLPQEGGGENAGGGAAGGGQ